MGFRSEPLTINKSPCFRCKLKSRKKSEEKNDSGEEKVEADANGVEARRLVPGDMKEFEMKMGEKYAGPWDARNRPEHERCRIIKEFLGSGRIMEEKVKTMRACLQSSSGPTSLFLQGHQRVLTPSSILTIAVQFLAQYNTFGLIEGGDRKLGKMCTTHQTHQTHHTQHPCHHFTHRKTPCLERKNYNLSYTSSSRPYRGSCTRRLMRVPRSSAMRDDWMYSSSPCLQCLKSESDQKNEKEVNRIEALRQARLVHSLPSRYVERSQGDDQLRMVGEVEALDGTTDMLEEVEEREKEGKDGEEEDANEVDDYEMDLEPATNNPSSSPGWRWNEETQEFETRAEECFMVMTQRIWMRGMR